MTIESLINKAEESQLAPLSDKQKEFIYTSYNKVNIAHGGVRGGKNFAIDLRLIAYMVNEPIGYTNSIFGFLAESKDVIERNVFEDLRMLIGENNIQYSSYTGSGSILGRRFQIFNYREKRSIKKLRGSTLSGLMITEAIFCPEDIFDESMRRCSKDNDKEDSLAKVFIDTNPGNQYHYLYKKYISSKLEHINSYHFTYRDNKSLSKSYIKFLLSLYPQGTLKNMRYVEGLWVAGEGIIYDCFIPATHIIKPEDVPYYKIQTYSIGIDHGSVNATCYIKIGWDGYNLYVFDEYYYDPIAKMKSKTNVSYTLALAAFLKGTQKPQIFIDPAADSFQVEVEESLDSLLKKLNIFTNGFFVEHAYNSFHEGVDVCNVLFAQNRLFISKDCVNLIEQISNLVWNIDLAVRTGDEKPLSGVNHATDAFRYGVVSFMKQLIGDLKNIYVEEDIDYNEKYKGF